MKKLKLLVGKKEDSDNKRQDKPNSKNEVIETPEQSYIKSVPAEILALIFFFVNNPYELAKLSQVSKLFLQIACDDRLWMPFLDASARQSLTGLVQEGRQPVSVKQFIVQQHSQLLRPFAFFSNLMTQMQTRKENSLHILYSLDELVIAAKNKNRNKKIKNKSTHELMREYSVVINLLNQFFDLAVSKMQQVSEVFRCTSIFRVAFVDIQEVILKEKTKSMFFQHPKILALMLQFAKDLKPEQEYKLMALLDVLKHPKVKTHQDIEKVIEYVIEYMNTKKNEEYLSNQFTQGKELDESVVSHVLAKIATENRMNFKS